MYLRGPVTILEKMKQGSVIKNVNGVNMAIPTSTPPTKKEININKWRISPDKYLISYTAKWCGPCQRIKPTLLELTKNNKHIGGKTIPKDTRPEHVKFIPWFDIVMEDETVTNSIQTSNTEELTKFLNIPILKSFDYDF